MAPRYGTVEQIRRGNMGHAAIEVDGRLYDIGALNGYAYTLRGAPAVRFWNFTDMDAALAAVRGHPDADGHLDRLVVVRIDDARVIQFDAFGRDRVIPRATVDSARSFPGPNDTIGSPNVFFSLDI